jgi:hypothetical protein
MSVLVDDFQSLGSTASEWWITRAPVATSDRVLVVMGVSLFGMVVL